MRTKIINSILILISLSLAYIIYIKERNPHPLPDIECEEWEYLTHNGCRRRCTGVNIWNEKLKRCISYRIEHGKDHAGDYKVRLQDRANDHRHVPNAEYCLKMCVRDRCWGATYVGSEKRCYYYSKLTGELRDATRPTVSAIVAGTPEDVKYFPYM